MAKNTLVKVNNNRATRWEWEDAMEMLRREGYTKGSVLRHTVRRDGLQETIVTEWHRYGNDENGSPFYDRIRITETCAI